MAKPASTSVPTIGGCGSAGLKCVEIPAGANVSSLSSSFSSDEAGLNVLEKDVGGAGAGAGGNIRVQFLGNVSTMA